MNEHATNPFDEQVVFPKKLYIPELIACECPPYPKEYRCGYRFNGSIFRADKELWINGHIAGDVLMKPNCTCAISQSNKRYLETFELLTDHVEPNMLLVRSLGFSENECKQMVYARDLDMIPLNFVITGYDVHGDKAKLSKPEVGCTLKNGIPISREEAIKVLADWMMDNDYCISTYEQMMECNTIQEAMQFANISEAAAAYGMEANTDEAWEALEFASLYDLASQYVDHIVLLSNAIYPLLAKKYEEAGVLLVNTTFAFGFDEECNLCLGDEVGTPDTSLLASKELYEKNGIFESMDKSPVMRYFESVAYTGEKGQNVPEVPSSVLDEVSDTYVYLAKTLCDDLALELHM